MAVQIQIRRGIGTEWSNVNPTLADGEIAYDKTTKQLKIGDGSSSWDTLQYFSPNTIGITTVVNVAVVSGVITAFNYVSTVATGTPPLAVASTTLNTNFNADLLDGQHGSYYLNASNINAGTLNGDRLPLNISIGSSIEIAGSSGDITATNYYGSGENLTGIVTSIVAGTNITVSSSNGQVTINSSGGGGGGDGIGTPLSEDPTNPLNLIYKTPTSTTIPINTLTTIQSDSASGNIAFTRLNTIVVSTGSTLTVSTGTTFIMNVLNVF